MTAYLVEAISYTQDGMFVPVFQGHQARNDWGISVHQIKALLKDHPPGPCLSQQTNEEFSFKSNVVS